MSRIIGKTIHEEVSPFTSTFCLVRWCGGFAVEGFNNLFTRRSCALMNGLQSRASPVSDTCIIQTTTSVNGGRHSYERSHRIQLGWTTGNRDTQSCLLHNIISTSVIITLLTYSSTTAIARCGVDVWADSCFNSVRMENSVGLLTIPFFSKVFFSMVTRKQVTPINAQTCVRKTCHATSGQNCEHERLTWGTCRWTTW